MFRKLIFMVIPIGLFACSEHDLLYYQSNLDKAEIKVNKCKAAFKKALSEKDEDRLRALYEDLECKAAEQAHDQYQREIAKVEREKRAEEQLKQYELEIKEYTKEFSDMPIEDFYAIRSECSRILFGKPTAKCKAFDDMKDTKVNTELKALIDKYGGDKLSEYSQEQCEGIKYNELNCDLAREALDKHRKDKIDFYLENRDELKSVFNACQEQYAELRKDKKFNEAKLYLKTFQCSVVADAARKIKIYNFSKPIG